MKHESAHPQAVTIIDPPYVHLVSKTPSRKLHVYTFHFINISSPYIITHNTESQWQELML